MSDDIVRRYIEEQTAEIVHQLPVGWQPGDWVVPTIDGRACIKHGHQNPNDHTNCGPTLWCCVKSLRLFCEIFADAEEARADWQLVASQDIEAWMDAGVATLWFGFCDPDRPRVVRLIGTQYETARETLARDIPLEDFLDEAHLFSLDQNGEVTP